jgi:hypothetical protein
LGDQPLDLFTSTPVAVAGLPLRIDRDEVLRFQGYKPGIDLPTTEVVAILDEAIGIGEDIMAPCLVYRAEPVTAQGASWIEAGGQRLDIPEIGRLWGRLQAVGAGICTVGDAIEARVRE